MPKLILGADVHRLAPKLFRAEVTRVEHRLPLQNLDTRMDHEFDVFPSKNFHNPNFEYFNIYSDGYSTNHYDSLLERRLKRSFDASFKSFVSVVIPATLEANIKSVHFDVTSTTSSLHNLILSS